MLLFAFVLEWLNPVICLKQKCPDFAHAEEDGHDQQFVELKLCKVADVAVLYAFQSGHRCCSCGDLCADVYVAGAIFGQGFSIVFNVGHFLQWFVVHGNAGYGVP